MPNGKTDPSTNYKVQKQTCLIKQFNRVSGEGGVNTQNTTAQSVGKAMKT